MEIGWLSSCSGVADTPREKNSMFLYLADAVGDCRAGKPTSTLNSRNSTAADCNGFGCGGDPSATLI